MEVFGQQKIIFS